jgi:methionyl aminopeptidase
MVILKSAEEIEKIARACEVVSNVLVAISQEVRPGVTTRDLDRFAEEFIVAAGAKPAFKGYRGFTGTLCTSLNEQVVHGIPGSRVLKEGDLLSVDCGAIVDGFYGDAARSFAVGKVSVEAQAVMDVTRESLDKGIEQMRVGKRLHDISWAVQQHAEAHGFSVVRDFVGHGIGRNLHEEPPVPNYGRPDTGMKLEAGLVLAIEPMVNVGSEAVRILDDGWTAVTVDGKLSAHFEDTIAITREGPRILTRVAT